MKTWTSLSLLCVLLQFAAAAQSKNISGLWEGSITMGGLQSTAGYKIELWLEQKGAEIRGKTYVHLSSDEVVQMTIKGTMYKDRSIYFEEIEFIAADGQHTPAFHRRYQLIHNRSIWDASLEGYWQEITNEVMSDTRQLGRIFLKKVEGSKA